MKTTSIQFVEDHVVGSGFSTWGWWRAVHYDAGILMLEIEDPNGFEAEDTIDVALPSAAVYYTFLAHLNPDTAQRKPWAQRIDTSDPDLDASDVDNLLQTVIFGEIVYG